MKEFLLLTKSIKNTIHNLKAPGREAICESCEKLDGFASTMLPISTFLESFKVDSLKLRAN